MTNASTATNAMLIESPSVAEVFEQSPKAQYQQRPHRPAARHATLSTPDPEGLRKAGPLTTFHDGVQIDDDHEAMSEAPIKSAGGLWDDLPWSHP